MFQINFGGTAFQVLQARLNKIAEPIVRTLVKSLKKEDFNNAGNLSTIKLIADTELYRLYFSLWHFFV